MSPHFTQVWLFFAPSLFPILQWFYTPMSHSSFHCTVSHHMPVLLQNLQYHFPTSTVSNPNSWVLPFMTLPHIAFFIAGLTHPFLPSTTHRGAGLYSWSHHLLSPPPQFRQMFPCAPYQPVYFLLNLCYFPTDTTFPLCSAYPNPANSLKPSANTSSSIKPSLIFPANTKPSTFVLDSITPTS